MQAELPDELIITLKKPITFNDEEFTELRLREPIADEVDKFSKAVDKDGAVSGLLQLIAKVADVPLPVVRKIRATEMKKAEKYLGGFLEDEEDIQTDGEKS